ncbi:MAG TPA: hypothetical protein VIM79_03630 [Niastella sp.]
MNTAYYLQEFQSACNRINKKPFDDQQLQIFSGIVLNSAVVKVYKPEWSNDPQNALTATSRIFFSIWVNAVTIKENRLYYNIHAFKLRQLNGHKIASRPFAEQFRDQFKKHSKGWPNVDTQYGPLTLMQGWKLLDHESLQDDSIKLVQQFLKIAPIVDTTLEHYKIS